MINQEKLNRTMRSLYRYSELKEMSSPESLIDVEKKILQKRLSELDCDEILYLIRNFSEYYTSTKTEEAVLDVQLDREWEAHVLGLN